MTTTPYRIVPLIDLESTTFATQYQQGLHWLLFARQEHVGPLSDEDVVKTIQSYSRAGLFDQEYDLALRQALGFYLGTIHAGVLYSITGQLHPEISTLVSLHTQDGACGYHAGREWFFVDADLEERRYTESRFIERLRESVLEMLSWNNDETVWCFAIGSLLGELSGQLFALTAQERLAWQPQLQHIEHTSRSHKMIERPTTPQPVRHLSMVRHR